MINQPDQTALRTRLCSLVGLDQSVRENGADVAVDDWELGRDVEELWSGDDDCRQFGDGGHRGTRWVARQERHLAACRSGSESVQMLLNAR
jgi:hypothetical protein